MLENYEENPGTENPESKSIISIKNQKSKYNKPKLLRLLWDIIVFRLVVYLLNMICLNLLFLYNIWYFSIYREHQIKLAKASINS